MSKSISYYIRPSGGSSEKIDDNFKIPKDTSGPIDSPYLQLINDVQSIQKSQNTFEKRIKANTEKELDKARRDAKQASEEIEKIRNEIKSTQIKSVEMLSIFVALFTFISIDFSVLKSLQTVRDFKLALSLILIAGGLLTSFALMIDALLGGKLTTYKNLLWGTSIFLILSGIVTFYKSLI